MFVRLAAVLAVVVLAGCGSSPKASFYTLSSAAAPRQAPAASAPYRIAIGMVTVPDVIDRPQIVTRTGANQVTIDEFARWAEPLQGEIPRVMAANLARDADGALVSTYPQSANIDADCKLLLEVQSFESAPGGDATVEVLWTLRPAKGESKSGRSVAREATGGPGYDELVAAHGRALAAVSRDVAAAVQAMRARP